MSAIKKCFKVYPKIEIDNITADQAIIMETGMKKLEIITQNKGTNGFYYSCYTCKHYNSDEWLFVIMMNEARTESLKNRSIADSYIKLREWQKGLEKIAKELMEAAGITS